MKSSALCVVLCASLVAQNGLCGGGGGATGGSVAALSSGAQHWTSLDNYYESVGVLGRRAVEAAREEHAQQVRQAPRPAHESDNDSGECRMANEFAAHASLWRLAGAHNNDDDDSAEYLCAATLISARYALTLASCVLRHSPQALLVQTNEFEDGRQLASAGELLASLPAAAAAAAHHLQRVARVHVFPRFAGAADSQEHNLALVELAKPIRWTEDSIARPACFLRANNNAVVADSAGRATGDDCFAITRELPSSELFDPYGDGETRLERAKYAQLATVRVELVADEIECFNRTKQRHFNFKHPNFICSADFRLFRWRQKLSRPTNLGAGVYCNEPNGERVLVSIVQPVAPTSLTAYGYLDLSYYGPWLLRVLTATRRV